MSRTQVQLANFANFDNPRGSLRFVLHRDLRLPLVREVLRESAAVDQDTTVASPSCDDEAGEGAVTGGGDSWRDSVPKPLQACSLFRPGALLKGKQQIARTGPCQRENWDVSVMIRELDLERGYCSGDMTAENVPLTSAPVTTYWEGEIIDGIAHSFVTCKWNATYNIDLDHWRKFPAFDAINKQVSRLYGRCNTLCGYSHIFMRWKESFFEGSSKDRCSLTIAGFYYICFDRRSGCVEGYYFDPNSTPYQKLELKPASFCPTFVSRKLA